MICIDIPTSSLTSSCPKECYIIKEEITDLERVEYSEDVLEGKRSIGDCQ